ncbi:MAG: DUF4203 domain-containing protein [Syntrophobacterales bacterium]|nr:DUF4203 domain-containing protein [Syntrophobacterales bacterium]
MDVWMGVAAVLVGGVSCFYGYPLFRLLLVLAGLIVGYGLGQLLVQSGHPWVSLAIGVVAAVLLAVLAYPLWSLGVALSGGALGFLILSALAAAAEASQGVSLIAGLLGALILGGLFYHLRDLLVMLTTAVNGALEVVLGVGWLVPSLAVRRGPSAWLWVAAVAVLAAVGFAVQYGMFKDRRTYSRNST